VSHLKQKLQSYSDYDEIKRELDIMKVGLLALSTAYRSHITQYVEFAGAEEDDQDESSVDGYDVQLPNPNAEKANSQQGKSLEALLALKNKRILDELAKFRVRAPRPRPAPSD
jgi:homeobox protein cut-like